MLPHLTCQGVATAALIHTAMDNNTFYNSKVLSYNTTAEGAWLYSTYLQTAKDTFPQYVEELQGLADGAKMDFSKV